MVLIGHDPTRPAPPAPAGTAPIPHDEIRDAGDDLPRLGAALGQPPRRRLQRRALRAHAGPHRVRLRAHRPRPRPAGHRPRRRTGSSPAACPCRTPPRTCSAHDSTSSSPPCTSCSRGTRPTGTVLGLAGRHARWSSPRALDRPAPDDGHGGRASAGALRADGQVAPGACCSTAGSCRPRSRGAGCRQDAACRPRRRPGCSCRCHRGLGCRRTAGSARRSGRRRGRWSRRDSRRLWRDRETPRGEPTGVRDAPSRCSRRVIMKSPRACGPPRRWPSRGGRAVARYRSGPQMKTRVLRGRDEPGKRSASSGRGSRLGRRRRVAAQVQPYPRERGRDPGESCRWGTSTSLRCEWTRMRSTSVARSYTSRSIERAGVMPVPAVRKR